MRPLHFHPNLPSRLRYRTYVRNRTPSNMIVPIDTIIHAYAVVRMLFFSPRYSEQLRLLAH
jgi:hypothetical protein